jgi:hypothetical protein
VVVDAHGKARAVVAARDSTGDLGDLWWAHTGGGGGNFGVVTRFWFRSPTASGTDPGHLLPRPPASVIVNTASWAWSGLTQATFRQLVTNFCSWYARNSAPDSPYTALSSQLKVFSRNNGTISLATAIDATLPDSRGLLDWYYSALSAGISRPTITEDRALPPGGMPAGGTASTAGIARLRYVSRRSRHTYVPAIRRLRSTPCTAA